MSEEKIHPNCDICKNLVTIKTPLQILFRCAGQGGAYADKVYANDHCKQIFREIKEITTTESGDEKGKIYYGGANLDYNLTCPYELSGEQNIKVGSELCIACKFYERHNPINKYVVCSGGNK